MTALNFFLRAHTLCGLKPLPSEEDASAIDFGGENVKTSPFSDKAAKVPSQQVTFEIRESLIDCGGRYGSIPVGKACIGKLVTRLEPFLLVLKNLPDSVVSVVPNAFNVASDK